MNIKENSGTANTAWHKPDTFPVIPKNTENEFWIVFHSNHTGKTHVKLAIYQNRPLSLQTDGTPVDEDDCLYDCDGEPIHSVGWVSCKEHYEFESYYTALDFNSSTLLGWAELPKPIFTGVTE